MSKVLAGLNAPLQAGFSPRGVPAGAKRPAGALRLAAMPSLVMALALAGCAHSSARPHHGASPCAAGVWVEGHASHGGWRAGHWRCPKSVEVIELD